MNGTKFLRKIHTQICVNIFRYYYILAQTLEKEALLFTLS